MHERTDFQRDARVATAGLDGPTGLEVDRDGDEGDRQGRDERLRERAGSD
ncbi:MAG: hypothetical protein ABEJ94_00200 [Halorientalis sp.]